ncbi:MAG: flagellar hook-basal body complex protein FliE [Rhodobacterales bacterium]|nr:flagellar hook-basal body complex protein FliE [Rhodobacterales bacterium]
MADPVQASINGAINAYAKAAKSGADAASGKVMAARDDGAGGDFAGLVRSAIDEAVRIGKTSEVQSMAAVADRADLSQVVTAVAEAEVTLRTVVAVRDKVVEAYKEILRMPM